MRVLTMGNLYPPHHFGGYEQVWASAVGYLRERGHEVRVLALDFRLPDQDDGDEPDVHRTLRGYWKDHDFARVGLRERLRIERHNQRELAHHVEALVPDVLAFWSMGGMSHSLIEQGRRRGIPMVAFVHDEWLDYGRWKDQWTRLFRLRRYRWAAPVAEALTRIPTRVCYGVAGRFVFVSEFVRQRALALGQGLVDTAVAHSGIAPVFLSPGPAHDWRWRLLYVGRPHPDKGIEDAVYCLAELPPETTLTFAGSWDPREEAALEALVRARGLQARVSIVGRLPAAEIAELYRSADALLFPVRWEEPWGLVPLEAMGCGCPVVATGRGGSGEYLRDGQNCLLAPPRAPAALAGAIRRLANDRALRERVRAGGLATVPGYTEEAFNQCVEAHMKEVAARGPGRAAQSTPALEPEPRRRAYRRQPVG
jgi:glycosyltransferase involved in cell wall biosynthesis